jgi:hypothetical protein
MQAEQTTKMAARLYECRDAARSLLGAHYAQDMALWAMAIRGTAQTDGCSELAAATKMAKETDGFGAIVVMAAFVEMTEPSNAELRGRPLADGPA